MTAISTRICFRRLSSPSNSDDGETVFKQVNQYIILRKVGEGSFAKVYLAIDRDQGRAVALKRFKLRDLQRMEAGVSQLEREILAMRKVAHPNIVALKEVLHAQSSDSVYLVLDYANCGSLERVLRVNGKLDVATVRYVFVRVLAAISHLHSQGIVHQDIKPSNILVSGDGRVLLSDFGVGHSFQSAAMVVGTPAYQAPEALGDEDGDPDDIDPAVEDVWSLGVTLYECMFGKRPFTGDSFFEIVRNVKERGLAIPESENQDLVGVLKGMLAVDPKERMSVAEIIDDPFFKGPQKAPERELEDDDLEIDPDVRIEFTGATVCDAKYSFARRNVSRAKREKL